VIDSSIEYDIVIFRYRN